MFKDGEGCDIQFLFANYGRRWTGQKHALKYSIAMSPCGQSIKRNDK